MIQFWLNVVHTLMIMILSVLMAILAQRVRKLEGRK